MCREKIRIFDRVKKRGLLEFLRKSCVQKPRFSISCKEPFFIKILKFQQLLEALAWHSMCLKLEAMKTENETCAKRK
jgi:hypothetical protein